MTIIIKTKEQEYTLPKENLIPFAQYQAFDRGLMTVILSEDGAIEFLKSLGIEVVDYV